MQSTAQSSGLPYVSHIEDEMDIDTGENVPVVSVWYRYIVQTLVNDCKY